jgi:hypothetical protein
MVNFFEHVGLWLKPPKTVMYRKQRYVRKEEPTFSRFLPIKEDVISFMNEGAYRQKGYKLVKYAGHYYSRKGKKVSR